MNRDRGTPSLLDRVIRFCLEYRLVTVLIAVGVFFWGLVVMPFDWSPGWMLRNPVPVDAIPDIGENQQIVFTEWEGRSPRDVESQITYPLTVSLMGIPGVKTVRSRSMFGFSSVFIIFGDEVEFYWSRSRVLERLGSLAPDALPPGVQPALGPDATALGQVFWYTLEGLDPDGAPAGGWELDELRSIQDWTVRFALLSAEGVSEVASAGGYVGEYQVDVNPDALRAYGVTLEDVYRAVAESNLDVGARSIEINRVSYAIRGVGFIRSIRDIEEAVLRADGGNPLRVRHVARVIRGPAFRQGALVKDGGESVGGVVAVRYGGNPLEAIRNVQEQIQRIAPGLPSKAVVDYSRVSSFEVGQFATRHGFDAYEGAALNQDAWISWLRSTPRERHPEWIRLSQVTIVPFYDRTGLIYETLGTLSSELVRQILVTLLVILAMMSQARGSLLISAALPMSVALCFILMKQFGVDANIMSLGGIAIAIGTVVDMSILVSENILRHLDTAEPEDNRLDVIYRAVCEQGGAVLTAIATTAVSFMTIFALDGPEGKLFKPLARTYLFVLISSLTVALTLAPAFAYMLFSRKSRRREFKPASRWNASGLSRRAGKWIVAAGVTLWLGFHWLPLGPEKGILLNALFVLLLVGFLLGVFLLYRSAFPAMLRWCLDHKGRFAVVPLLIYLFGLLSWLGFDRMFGWLPGPVKQSAPIAWVRNAFPGLGREFMPPLEEGSYLFMPTTMPHAGIGEALEVLKIQDRAIMSVPEVAEAVGKLGRAESPLDPAPIEMFETVINIRPEFLSDRSGRRLHFRHHAGETDWFRAEDGTPVSAPDGQPYRVRGRFERDADGRLVSDRRGRPFRLWRPALDPELNPGRDAWAGIREPDDIWNALVAAASVPGTTSAPRLQPIAARIVMLQTGMRAPMGVRIQGPSLEAIEETGRQIESFLREVPSVAADTVVADRIVGKPYLEIRIRREDAARYGISAARLNETVEAAIGGRHLTTTVEGRRRYPVRVRYAREWRDSIEALRRVIIPGENGAYVPLDRVADLEIVRGPQEIRSEDGFLTGYVLFDKIPGAAEVNVVEESDRYLRSKLESGELILPPNVSFVFAGNFENQVRVQRKLGVVLPVSLFLIFLILYLQFRDIPTALLVFVDIASSWMAGFIALWLYGQAWFLNFDVMGIDLRELFQVHPINLSVAVWVGFLALFGIATDDGVVLCSHLNDSLSETRVGSIEEIRALTVLGAGRRVNACLMTTATTAIALLPVLTSIGRGADVMRSMAIPVFAGMSMSIITPLFVPVLYSWVKEFKFSRRLSDRVLRRM